MQIMQGCLCGMFISITINISIIFHFFFDMTTFSICLFPIIAGVIASLLLMTNTYKWFFISLLFAIILFILTEIIIVISGVILYFYQIHYGADQFPWAGDGFGMMFLTMFCLFGSGVGILAAFIATTIKREIIAKKRRE